MSSHSSFNIIKIHKSNADMQNTRWIMLEDMGYTVYIDSCLWVNLSLNHLILSRSTTHFSPSILRPIIIFYGSHGIKGKGHLINLTSSLLVVHIATTLALAAYRIWFTGTDIWQMCRATWLHGTTRGRISVRRLASELRGRSVLKAARRFSSRWEDAW